MQRPRLTMASKTAVTLPLLPCQLIISFRGVSTSLYEKCDLKEDKLEVLLHEAMELQQ
jgi:hypothetical protein